MAYKTLQNPGLYNMGNDYEQDMKYVVEYVDKDGKPTTKDSEGAKKTWRDGIYTKLAFDIKDPEGYNKRTVNVPQKKWATEFDTIPASGYKTMSGETDGAELFSDDYATAVSFGNPFSATSAVTKEVFDGTDESYYTSADEVKVPQGIDVASFRDVFSQKELEDEYAKTNA